MNTKSLNSLKQTILNSLTPESVYLSGPISAYGDKSVLNNIQAFTQYEQQLREQGLHVINPAAVGDLEADGFTYDAILNMWLAILASDKIRTVYMLPCWQKSKGAKIEHQLSSKLQKQIIYLK